MRGMAEWNNARSCLVSIRLCSCQESVCPASVDQVRFAQSYVGFGWHSSMLFFNNIYSSGPQTFWMLGQLRDLISVHAPNYFVHWQKTKQKTARITLVTFVHCNFFSLFGNMFGMWLLQLLLLVHNSCNMLFYAWCSNTLLLQFSKTLYT